MSVLSKSQTCKQPSSNICSVRFHLQLNLIIENELIEVPFWFFKFVQFSEYYLPLAYLTLARCRELRPGARSRDLSLPNIWNDITLKSPQMMALVFETTVLALARVFRYSLWHSSRAYTNRLEQDDLRLLWNPSFWWIQIGLIVTIVTSFDGFWVGGSSVRFQTLTWALSAAKHI